MDLLEVYDNGASALNSVRTAAERQRQREFDAAGPAARAHYQLSESALALVDVARRTDAPERLSIVFSELRPDSIFAGVSTALDSASALSTRLGLRLRVIVLHSALSRDDGAALANYLEDRLQKEVDVVVRGDLSGMATHPRDRWMATHWTTAHSLQVAALNGTIDAERVVYLIQDYEPGFHAWSTVYEVARGTYHAGFIPLVNSRPLAEYLSGAEGLEIPDDLIFGPSLDVATMQSVARARRSGPTKVLFYGRPSKPRNMFGLGVAALRHAVTELGDEAAEVEFVSAGQPHDAVDLGSGITMSSVGTLPWDDYFTLLTECDVVLSLQASPHPSHPPLEAAMTGARAVTNDFAGTRSGLHPRLDAVAAEPEALGTALARAVRASRQEGVAGYSPISDAALGAPLGLAVAAAAARIA